MRLTSGFAKFAVVLLAFGFSAGLAGCGKADKGTAPKSDMGKPEGGGSNAAIGGGSEVPMKADEAATSEPATGEPAAATTDEKPVAEPAKTEDKPAADAPAADAPKADAPAKTEDKPAADAPKADDK